MSRGKRSPTTLGNTTFPRSHPAPTRIKIQLANYKTFDRTGLRVGTQQFITLDVTLELGTLQETVTVTGAVAAHRHVERPRPAARSTASSSRRCRRRAERVPDRRHGADGEPRRRSAVQPPAGSDQRVACVARRRRYSREQLPARRRAHHGAARSRDRQPDDRSDRRGEGPGPHLRRRDGAHRRRRVQRQREIRDATSTTARGFYQTRPVWGQNLNFFSEKEGGTKESTGVADSYYRLYGGGVGGPIFRNRTFFWGATEGYRSLTTRGLQYVWPTARQRNGDFSRTTVGGAPVRLFNPWCRSGAASARCPATGTGSLATGGEFTGAIIPRTHPAANTVGFNILNAWPTETVSGRVDRRQRGRQPERERYRAARRRSRHVHVEGGSPLQRPVDAQRVLSVQQDRRAGSGIMPADFQYIENQAEFFTTLRRRPHVLAINNTNILNDTTVLTLRYGWQTWQDQTDTASYSSGPRLARIQLRLLNAINAAGRDDVPRAALRRHRRCRRMGWRSHAVDRDRTRSTAR